MAIFTSLLAGMLFGIGLIVSGMTNPAKILSFLDLAGEWNPSLIFVMAGALAIGFPAFMFAKRRITSFIGVDMKLPSARQIDRRLIIGNALFGIGWGVAGFCPGPAVVSLGMGGNKPVVFVASMVLGMGLFEFFESRLKAAPSDLGQSKK